MASYHYEILDGLLDYYKEDEKDFIAEMLSYLHNTTNDPKLELIIEDWCESNHYCCDCGSELICETHEERHTELEGCPCEYWYEYYCPNCDNK